MSLLRRRLLICYLIPIIGMSVGDANAGEPVTDVPAEIAATLATKTEVLKFREMFRLPLGAGGLEPSQKLLRLNGDRVRIVGYMVDQEQMRSFILAPLPLTLGDEDESLADDLPAGVVFVHVPTQNAQPLSYIPGLLELTGVLGVGNFAEADGRVSTVRLTLDPTTSQEIYPHVSR